MRTPLAVTALLISCHSATPPTRPPAAVGGDLPAALAAFRAATGGDAWDHVQTLETHATIAVAGMTGTADTVEDVPTGRSRADIHVTGFDQAQGFDGEHGWERSPGGEVVITDAPPAVADEHTAAWLSRRGFFHAAGARYHDLGERDEGGARYHVIEATPDAGSPIELWLDPSNHLARTVAQQGIDKIVTTFADWRTVAGSGVAVPYRITNVQGDVRNTVEMVASSVTAVATPSATAFAAPAQDAERISFAGGATRVDVPIELVNNHIYVDGKVDGKPVRLLVDTGGVNMLTPAAAARLGLIVKGKLAGAGVGEDKVDVGIAQGKSVSVGAVSLADPIFYVMEVGPLADVEGADFDGIVGFELFSRVRARIDYPGRALSLIAPAAFVAPAKAIAVPFEMNDRMPIVQGSVDGLAGRFWVDTGSRVALTTMAKFTRDHDLVGKYKPAFEAVTGWGVGGSTRSSPVRFHEVKVGGATVHEVVGDLFTGDKGAFADPDAAGNLGGSFLSRFIVTFDYAGKVMYLEPGPDADRRENYDRSGLFLLRDGDALKIASVIPNSPAARAGLRADDRITTIDGAAASATPLWVWRVRLREEAVGTAVKLHVETAGKGRDVTIKLAELVP